MSQNSLIVANGTGASVRSALNGALNTLGTLNSGASAPSTTVAYMLWADTTNDLLKIRNAANSAWITIGKLSATNLGLSAIPRWQLAGMTWGNNGADPTNDIDIATGSCASDDVSDAVRVLLNPGAMTKQLDVAWAAGTAAGGRISSESLVNGQWFIYAFRRTGGTDDYCFSQSLTPTLPDSGTNKRMIGWLWRASAAIVAFHAYETEGGGAELTWDSPTLDINLSATLTTSRRTDAVKVPLSFSVMAHLNVILQDASAEQQAWIYCPDQTDLAPSKTVAPLANVTSQGTGNIVIPTQIRVRTSSAGLIAARSNLSTSDAYLVSTIGFTWARRT